MNASLSKPRRVYDSLMLLINYVVPVAVAFLRMVTFPELALEQPWLWLDIFFSGTRKVIPGFPVRLDPRTSPKCADGRMPGS